MLALPDDLDWYDNWHTLVVHPTPFRQQMTRPLNGPLAEQQAITLAGMTGLQLPVIVNWQHAKPHRLGHQAHEVVIHELAHKIDLEMDDTANGQLPLYPDMAPKAWYTAFKSAFDKLNHCLKQRHCHLRIDAFAAPQTLHRVYPPCMHRCGSFTGRIR